MQQLALGHHFLLVNTDQACTITFLSVIQPLDSSTEEYTDPNAHETAKDHKIPISGLITINYTSTDLT